ncbi:MAG TPA: hypothetical protein H9860_09610 [Candidatus Gemmiger faecavium]|nr:hypothetical protein [Candidatus Gemmiger faecavium]
MPIPNRPRHAALQFAGRAVLSAAIALVLLFLLLLGAYALPGEPVRANIERSVPLLQEEGLYPEFFGFKLFQMDNYTDTIMLFEAASADETSPLQAMMTSTAYNVDNFETLPDDLAAYLDARAEGKNGADTGLEPFSYARYWHGYLIWLRPLLLFLTYGQVRVANYLLFAALACVLLWQLGHACGWRAAIWFAVSQILVSCFFVPRQMQFFTCFAVAYAACIWVLARPRTPDSLAVGLVVTGICTAFLDLLVTPILTLGLPLAVWLLDSRVREDTPLRRCGVVCGGALCWGAGYALCWASKWVLASLVTGQDIIGDALHQASVRTSADTWHGMELTWGNIIRFVWDTLSSHGLLIPLLLLAVICIGAFVLCLRSREALLRALPLALTALSAPAWLCLLRTHSIQHGWFTWRALGVTLFAGFAFVWQACSLKSGVGRVGRLLRR